jgi:hypothetical protein
MARARDLLRVVTRHTKTANTWLLIGRRGRKDPSDRLRRLGPQGPDAVDQASAAKPISRVGPYDPKGREGCRP